MKLWIKRYFLLSLQGFLVASLLGIATLLLITNNANWMDGLIATATDYADIPEQQFSYRIKKSTELHYLLSGDVAPSLSFDEVLESWQPNRVRKGVLFGIYSKQVSACELESLTSIRFSPYYVWTRWNQCLETL